MVEFYQPCSIGSTLSEVIGYYTGRFFPQIFTDFDVMRRFGIPEVGAIRFFLGKLRYLGQCRNASKKFRVALFRNKGGNALLYVLDNSLSFF